MTDVLAGFTSCVPSIPADATRPDNLQLARTREQPLCTQRCSLASCLTITLSQSMEDKSAVRINFRLQVALIDADQLPLASGKPLPVPGERGSRCVEVPEFLRL